MYNNWLPLEWNPTSRRRLPKYLFFDPLFIKAVQSPKPPYKQHALPINVSTNCPIVIRDGNAWGLIIISGFKPSSVNGISSSGIIKPIVPFCPHLEQNLSPIAGTRSLRTLTLANLNPVSPSVMKDLSTNPSCPFFGKIELSEETLGFNRLVVILPIRTFLSSTGVFSLIKPYSSKSP